MRTAGGAGGRVPGRAAPRGRASTVVRRASPGVRRARRGRFLDARRGTASAFISSSFERNRSAAVDIARGSVSAPVAVAPEDSAASAAYLKRL